MFTPLLPEPILFHPLKHHLQYIRQFILKASAASVSELKTELRTIGDSQLDLYTGELTSLNIAQEAKIFLEKQEINTPQAYKVYLTDAGTDFRVMRLSDKTEWVLRWGLMESRYVHLHPARYAPNTMRVKATSLKTAIATLIASNLTQTKIDLALINSIRKERLDLPPIKDFSAASGLTRLISFIYPGN